MSEFSIRHSKSVAILLKKKKQKKQPTNRSPFNRLEEKVLCQILVKSGYYNAGYLISFICSIFFRL